MKKILALTLITLLMLSIVGCEKRTESNSYKITGDIGGYTYPKFLNTDWGMTPEQVMTALGMTEKDFEIKTANEMFPEVESKSGKVYYATKIKIDGITEMVSLCFFLEEVSEMSEPAVGLTSVSISTINENTIELATDAKAIIEGSDKYIGKIEAFEFLEKMGMVDAVGAYYEELFTKEPGLSRSEGDVVQWVKDSCDKFPIKGMSISKTDDSRTVIRYAGDFYARYKYFAKGK